MTLSIFAFVLSIALASVASSIECRRNGMDFEFYDGDKVLEPSTFDCIRITKPGETTVHVNYLNDDGEGRKICQISDDGNPKEKKVYIRSELKTGMSCNYICRESEGLYKCDAPTKPIQNSCICHPAKPRVLIHPVESISGQGDEEEEKDSCEDKPEGYQFADPVPCSSITGDVTKLRVNYINEDLDKCSAVLSMKKETKYSEETPKELNLQGCLFVCKKAGPKCVGEIEDGKCDCQSPGLRKRLVAMDTLGVRDLLTQKRCVVGLCGPCGSCDGVTGLCGLHHNAHEGNFCDCGEVCPQRDLRALEHRGGKILCRPNVALDCMKKPRWLTSLFEQKEPGTRYANMCTSGRVDATDTCSCATGYMEQPGPFSGVYCVKRR